MVFHPSPNSSTTTCSPPQVALFFSRRCGTARQCRCHPNNLDVLRTIGSDYGQSELLFLGFAFSGSVYYFCGVLFFGEKDEDFGAVGR
jgi:hypothetical protein